VKRELAVALALALSLSPAKGQSDRFALAQFELDGPLTALEIAAGDSARGTLAANLAAGERLRVNLALPIEATLAAEAPPLVRVVGDGSARFVGWNRDAARAREEAWAKLPLALRVRPCVNPTAPVERRVPNAALWIAAAGALLAIGARTRPWAALACGAAAALAAGWLTSAQGGRPARLRLIEIDGASGRAVAVDSARDSLGDAELADLRWESTPPHAPLRATARRDGAGFELAGPGAVVRRWTSFEVGAATLGAAVQRLGLLAPVWRRETAGEWSGVADWAAGESWSSAAAAEALATSAPPGWLQPALPLGVRVVVGRWRSATPAESGGAGEVWVRWIGP
jgi:hypothetical protein